MLTIKHVQEDGSEEIVPVVGDVSIGRQGDGFYEEEIKRQAQCGLEASGCRAVIFHEHPDGSYRRRFLYEKDRSYVMNANGKTIATV